MTFGNHVLLTKRAEQRIYLQQHSHSHGALQPQHSHFSMINSSFEGVGFSFYSKYTVYASKVKVPLSVATDAVQPDKNGAVEIMSLAVT